MVKPQQVAIEVTNRCNLQCKYCPNVENAKCASEFPVGDMRLEFFKSIVDRIDFDCSLLPWLNGEPLLHPNYLEMLKYITKKGIKFYTTTNLTIWNEELFTYYLRDSTAYQLIVSMDGLIGTGNIAKARPGSNEISLMTNIGRLLSLKARLNSKVELGFKICERGQDWEEIENYIQHWLANDTLDFIIVGKALKDINPESMRVAPCQYFDPKLMLIRWDGSMVLCGYNNACVNGMQLSYGKLDSTMSILEMYNNPFITDLREKQHRGIFIAPCDTCSFAYTGHGYEGIVSFREDGCSTPYYYSADYYNMFFSKHHSHRVPKEFYLDNRRS